MRGAAIVIRPRRLPISMLIDRRVPSVLLALAIAALVAMVVSVGSGEYRIPPLDVLKAALRIETQ